ncbi:cobalt ABC transporter, ATPase subunit [Denitrovibrio acetiphilus DSM 12809]|uniref:ABC transporter ATP-binding protein n=1 Tax=Denitrovibrio acetiphilus (strain DSM 12809 / NBRC 114555 / N2460) TaxID=522772 RepID=D4H2P6_DENA2|nr:ABC transporter ATP-binding protein [Denitrovibrio acetiphilus]ADD67107.1 cobalt ABC transporter, ATPase subunit [Denitrovibrio acetiphilus DSM 12809]
MSHHLVEVKDLFYNYPDGSEVLSGISFRITHGESVAIVGENGAGKSTLLLHLNGYYAPAKGEVRVGDMPVVKSTLNEIRKTVGMLFQDSDDQLFMPTVFDDVAFGPLNLGIPDAEVERKVAQALECAGVLHLKERSTHKLSTGEKKAVAFAGILAMSPDILVLDEPSASLDPKARRRMIKMLKSFTHTKIIATHDLDMAYELCDRVIVMHEGKIAADDTPDNIFTNDELLERCMLERPLSMQDDDY